MQKSSLATAPIDPAPRGAPRWPGGGPRLGLLGAVLAGGLLAGGCPPPPPAPEADGSAARYRTELAGWREERVAHLTAEDGWLSVVELGWLGEGDNRVGSGPDAAVVLPPSVAPPFVGTFERRGMEAAFTPQVHGFEQVSPAVVAGERAALRPGRSRPMASDAGGVPTVVALGGVQMFVIERGDRLGVRVRDPQSPARRDFAGIDAYPVDRRWRVEARLEMHDPPRTMRVPNVLGTITEQPSPGTAVFEVAGTTYRLDAMPGDEGELFFVFGDETNGDGSYGGGRFLYAGLPQDGEPLILDFNRAINPPCAFTAFATCPLPPRSNKLPLAIPAGERDYAGSSH